MSEAPPKGGACSVAHHSRTITMAHGGGGRKMRQLLQQVVFPALDAGQLQGTLDSAVLAVPSGRVALTTDSYVITPREFPGGDIGSLAVYGTLNDLAMVGARPVALTVGLIAEEGLPLDELTRIVTSLGDAARTAGVPIVTGDTKVVDRGHGHGLYINTSGLGVVPDGLRLGHEYIASGDAVLVSGDVGRHGIAVLSVREGLQFETSIQSDAAPLVQPVLALLEAGVQVRFLRDLTRGGLATALCEMALDGALDVEIEESSVVVDDAVAGACELLGFDPLYVANEGRFVAVVAASDATRALEILRSFPACEHCARVGRVVSAPREGSGRVAARTSLGMRRLLDLLSGEQLPRIC